MPVSRSSWGFFRWLYFAQFITGMTLLLSIIKRLVGLEGFMEKL
jgi:hypothetical protein